MKMKMKKILFLSCSALIIFLAFYFGFFFKPSHTSDYFQIETIKSSEDFNNNEIDDYTDILNGAKMEVKNKPKYDGCSWSGGYPPDDIGVCTDVIWRAFKNAGYNLRDMLNKDVKENPNLYTNIKTPDKDIDFRRVQNLKVFFKHHALSLTINPYEISDWQPGDIVIYKNHIAIVSDKRNPKGIPYIIHNWGQRDFEEDALINNEIVGHYRFDAKLVDKNFLIRWT